MKTHKLQIYQQIHIGSHLAIRRKKQLSLLDRITSFFKRATTPLTHTDLMHFFRQLATLITAGVTLSQSCDILQQSEENSALRTLIQSLKNALNSGQSLTIAMQQHPSYFDTLTIHLISIGEQSGTLDSMLNRISAHKEKSHRTQKKIRQALIYPAFIFITALVIEIFLLVFVVPRFVDLFQHFHGKLPLLTQMVISLSDFLRTHAWLLLIPLTAMYFFFRYYSHFPNLKKKIDKTLLKIPITGKLLQKLFLARFARTLCTLFSAGISLSDALKMMTNFNKNHIFTTSIEGLYRKITTGQHLYHAMHTCDLFPMLMIQMVKVGEESGALPQILEKTAEYYELSTDDWINHFSQLLEPLIIIFLGVLIGGLVIAMYLPIFKLGTMI